MKSPKHNSPRRARLSDVAKEAGVSLGAASKALSHPTEVRAKTLAAVRAAVEKLGYIPSDAARALASRSTRMVGIVLPTINNPVYAAFVHDVQKLLVDAGYLLLALAHEYDRDREIALIESLVQRRVDALILVGRDHSPRTIDLLATMRVPHLFAWTADDPAPQAVIGFSNRLAMAAIADHLATLGHRTIAVLTGETETNERARWRLAGIEEAAARRGMRIAAVETVALSVAGGREGLHRLAPLEQGITAVVCATDIVAAGALAAARDLAIDIPGELSITGFDDIDMAEILTPALTTVRAPIADMARAIGERVPLMLAGGSDFPSLTLPTSLMIRDSTGPAPGLKPS